MAGSAQQYINSVGVTTIAVAPGGGALNAFVIPPIYAAWTRIGYMSGGSLSIVNNATNAAAGSSGANGFLLSGTEIPIDGACRFYLAATGTTAVAKVMWGFSPGASTLFMPG